MSMHVSIQLTIPCDPDWFCFDRKKTQPPCMYCTDVCARVSVLLYMCVRALVFVRVCFEMRNLFGYDIRVTFIRN